MAFRARLFAIVGLPIVVALLFAAWQMNPTDADMEAIDHQFDEPDPPALELLQRSAKITHMAKAPINLLESAVHGKKPGDISKKSASVSGVGANGKGNLAIFITGIITDLVVVIVCCIIFASASKAYPIIFQDNVLKGTAPGEVPPGFFGWASASWNLTVDEAWNSAGLDHAMLLEYTSLCLNTFKWIALPMFFIMGPLNWAYGGNADKGDNESDLSMGNVEFFCWLYWPISVAICYVSWCVCSMCHKGMREFLPMRFEWLRAMRRLGPTRS